jgi:hypothetical protein
VVAASAIEDEVEEGAVPAVVAVELVPKVERESSSSPIAMLVSSLLAAARKISSSPRTLRLANQSTVKSASPSQTRRML